MQNNLLQIIKKAALDAVLNTNPANIVFGVVESVNPLKVKLDQFITLDQAFLIVPDIFLGKEITVSFTDCDTNIKYYIEPEEEGGDPIEVQMDVQASGDKLTFNIQDELKENDKLALLQLQGGQKYFILSKVI